MAHVVAFVVLLAVGSIAAACQPPPPAVSDPREILRLTAGRLAAAASVHAAGSVDGTFQVDALVGALRGGVGSGGAGLPGGTSNRGVPLTGTRVEADLVMATGNAAVHLELPALLGLSVDLRRIGPDVYVSTTTLSRGWHRVSAAADVPFGAGRPTDWAPALGAWLQQPARVPVRLEDASCGSGTCYQVRLDVSATDLAAMLASAPGLEALRPGLSGASAQAVMLVDRATLDLSDLTLALDLGPTGSFTAAVRFSRWNAVITIPTPPPNEIVENG